ncbi:hypothetical protein [Janthinobacterium sp. RT4P48]|uniref:hypothetical protein n=1 Tax=Janthinobacterium sp. RT4P48 TaxID=3424188 RepID=UPI003F235FD7
MRLVAGERDNLIMNTVPRFQPANDRVLLLAATAPGFKVAATTIATPASIDFTAGLVNMQGQVVFAASNASVLTRVGNVASLTSGGMVGDSVTVTATIVVDGLTYTASQTVSKVFDGITGNSSRICYSKSTLLSLASTPATISTSGSASFPPLNTWGAGTVWEGSPPLFGAGELLYRSDGIFNPASGTTSWAAPYLNAWKVGQLSAIAADLGRVTAGDMQAVTIHGGPGYAHSTPTWPTDGLGGFHLSAAGLLIGNYNTGKYFQATPDGNVYMPGVKVEGGLATFSGNITTGSGTGFRIEMGPTDPIYAMWAGAGAKNDVNAVFYLKRDGAGYFGGALTAGTLRTAVTSPEINPNAQLVNGPFGSNGGLITVICSFAWSRTLGSTRATYTAGAGSTQAVVKLYRGLAGGPTDTLLATSTFTGPPAAIENTVIFEEMSTCSLGVSGSFTFTDDARSNADHTYRVTVAMVEQAVTIGSRPGADRPPLNAVIQRLSNTTAE